MPHLLTYLDNHAPLKLLFQEAKFTKDIVLSRYHELSLTNQSISDAFFLKLVGESETS